VNRQKEHVERVKAVIETKKECFFARTGTSKDIQISKLIQYCLLPRCTFSEVDAVYCAKFINLLHSFRTGYFNTLVVFDKVGFNLEFMMLEFVISRNQEYFKDYGKSFAVFELENSKFIIYSQI
jgi:hypothetical protein